MGFGRREVAHREDMHAGGVLLCDERLVEEVFRGEGVLRWRYLYREVISEPECRARVRLVTGGSHQS